MVGTRYEPVYKKRREAWRSILFDNRDGASDSITQARLNMLDTWRHDPWAYVTARDVPNKEWPEGKPIIWTVDGRDDEHPVKPFPVEKLYLREVLEELWRYRFVFVDKIRQKMISTLCCLAIDWYCAFTAEREVVVSKIREEDSTKLINDMIRQTNSRKPEWLQRITPITAQPAKIITYPETGSTVTAVAQNFASSGARGITASLVLIDEAAFQEQFPEIYGAIVPMAARLWAVSTANIGNPGAALFKRLVFEGRPGMAGEAPEEVSA